MSANMKDMVALFEEFVGKFDNFENYFHRAEELEHRGDQQTHEIIDHLNQTFITPFDREDIYSLSHELDDVMDLIEKVIHDVHVYKITERIPALEKFLPLIREANACVAELLTCLEKKKYTPRLLDIKIRVHELEDQGDLLFDEAMAALFKEGKDAITVIKVKDILQDLEDLMDQYQRLSDMIEGIIVKST